MNRSLGTSKNLLNAGLRLLRIKLAAARDPIAALGGANAKLASARSLTLLASARDGFSRCPYESVRGLLLELNDLSIRPLIAFNGFLADLGLKNERFATNSGSS
ncbi:hypothetical protein, partial [Halothiobacillus sp.]|uniref:hypothetical protein n=1 Tax=Halothiobacillus sp. TaxID=1891311 RepID=UPI003D09A8A9